MLLPLQGAWGIVTSISPGCYPGLCAFGLSARQFGDKLMFTGQQYNFISVGIFRTRLAPFLSANEGF